ncbi:uncharacterized protein LOC117471407 isoform X1 [Trematomus bernacchii]|uniref:uncharacterized protein LOC117471407 isoform X1 n=1 Tax=Trematomus bernacchii TaxID=40690 RepID=UPI00146ED0AE|nr:uncharacterized protein LOC117471407 isoform X1 [Trematomus bernacchii]
MAFVLEQFVASPTVGQLDWCRKVDLRLVADHYHVSVSSALVKSELKATVITGLVEQGVLSLPTSVESPGTVAGAVAAESPGGGRVGVTPGVQSATEQAKLFNMPQLDSFSAGSSPTGSKLDARVKVRMARLQWEKEERDRDFQLRRELEIRKLELEIRKLEADTDVRRELEIRKVEADTAVRMRQLELQAAGGCDSAVTSSGPAASFDVSRHISLVPVFRESEVEIYFGAFERIAAALRWPEDVWAILLQCKLVGKAQEACSYLSVEDSLVYENVKGAVLRAYELVPEAYRQRFRGLMKTSGQTYVDFAREKKVLFDRWCRACKADDITSVCELMIEEFKNCVPERTVVYLNEQKVTTLQQAATLADEFALIHKSVFFQRDTYRRAPDNYVPCASVPVLDPRLNRACFFCHDPGHVIADCAGWKREQTAAGKHPEGVGLVTAVRHSGRATVNKGPDECLKPFISTAFVSLSGKVEDQRQVTVLRDSGGSQSFILASVLPLSAESACEASAVVRGIGMGCVPAPLHKIQVQSKLATGFFPVAVLPKFPVDGVDFIMGNDIAGGKVYPTAEVVDVSVPGAAGGDLAQTHPKVFAGCVLTRTRGPKRLCFFCLDPGHLVAGCVAWKQQVAASKQSTEKSKDQHPDYNIVIKHKRGADKVVADVLYCG